MDAANQSDPLETIPEPEIVREKLRANLAERRLLRQLLTLAERSSKQVSNGKRASVPRT
jgi:hypothetical protein